MIGQANAQNVTINVGNPKLDIASFLKIAKEFGYLSPDAVEGMREQLERTQADLDEMRRRNPDFAAEIDQIIEKFNAAKPDETRVAFVHLRQVISSHRHALQQEEAKLYHAEATLLYPFDLTCSLPLLEKAATLAQTNFWYWIEYGRALMVSGNLEKAEQAFRTAHDLVDSNDNHIRARMIVEGSLGDIYALQGNGSAVLMAYKKSLKIQRRLSAIAPHNSPWQCDVSVSLNKIGAVLFAHGDELKALESYEEALEISRHLLAVDPQNADRQRNVAISLGQIGTVLLSQGDRLGAFEASKEGLEISRHLLAVDPQDAGRQRDVAVLLEKIGNALFSQGEEAGALAAYEEALEISRRLSARDSQNVEWRRDVFLFLLKTGEVLSFQEDKIGALATYKEALEVIRCLSATDPQNMEWRNDVSASLERIGDALLSQGEGAGAFTAYEEALEINCRLSAVDPQNAEWQRGVFISLNKIGNVFLFQEDKVKALAVYREAFAIMCNSLPANWQNPEWQRDIVISLVNLAQADPSQAAGRWGEAVALLEDMKVRGVLAPIDEWMLDDARAQLAVHQGNGFKVYLPSQRL